MIYFFESRPRVYDDIFEAVDYFYSINPTLAEDFLYRIDEAKERITNKPKGFARKYSEVRTILLKQFDYHLLMLWKILKLIFLTISTPKVGKRKSAQFNFLRNAWH